MPDIRVEQAARLATSWAKLGPIDLTVRETNRKLPVWAASSDTAFANIRYQYIETPIGQRFMDRVATTVKGTVAFHDRSYSDGTKFMKIEFRKDQIETPQASYTMPSFDNESRDGGSARPEPLLYYFVDKTPLHEALPTSTYLGSATHLGKPSHVFLFKEVNWGQGRQDFVVHLAEDGIIPHIVLAYKDEASRLKDTPIWSWRVVDTSIVAGHAFPMKTRLVGFDQTNPRREDSIVETAVETVEFGKIHPVSDFWQEVVVKPTTLDGAVSTVKPSTIQPVPVGNPIRVSPAADYAGYLSVGGLILGFVLLIAGIVLWIRRARD